MERRLVTSSLTFHVLLQDSRIYFLLSKAAVDFSASFLINLMKSPGDCVAYTANIIRLYYIYKFCYTII